MNLYGDERLAAAIAAGEAEALRQAYRRYGPAVAAMAELMTEAPEERRAMVEDAFLALWLQAGSFDPNRASFATWFLTLAHRRAVLRLRRGGDAASSQADAGPAEAWAGRTGAEPFGDDETKRLVLGAFFGGLTHVELARLWGAPVERVRSLLRVGLIRLSECVERVA
jgi:RNA polymerase sigma-70 factor (ECF subfamily)